MEKERFTILPRSFPNYPVHRVTECCFEGRVRTAVALQSPNCRRVTRASPFIQGDPQERTLETSMLASKIGYLARGGLVSKTTAVAACC